MTPTGKLVFTIYSIIILSIFFISDLKRGEKAWKGALVIPTLILLMNI